MKTSSVLGAVLVLIAVTAADDDVKKAKVLNFYKCIACSEDPVPQEEFLECLKLKPKKLQDVSEWCKNETMPGVSDVQDCFELFCKDETVRDNFFNCMWTNQHPKELDENEKIQWKEYIKCAKRINKNFCMKDNQD